MDDHARRMIQRLLDALREFEYGQTTLLDLSRQAGQAAATVDNASSPLLDLLRRAESDFEYAYFTSELELHHAQAARILAPILAMLDDDAG